MKKIREIIPLLILIIIVCLALFVRLYNLDNVPPGLNRDEAAIGYTAYSLIKTGADEYGKNYPISFKSFGDWKVPVYFYLVIPFIKVLGLTEFATRLPSALFGSVTVLLVFILVRKLFQEKTNSKILPLLSSLIFAISPWHIFMSRNASESNIAVFIVVLSLVLFFYSFQKPKFLLISFFILSLSIFTYHGNHIFTPLLFLGLNIIYWNVLRKNKYYLSSILIFVILSAIIFSQTLFSADKTKISGLFPLSDSSQIYENIVKRRLEYPEQSLIVKILHNKPVYLVKTIVANYLKGLSPDFLFISGGSNDQHNIPGFGNLYLWEALSWFIGIIVLVMFYRKIGIFLLWWLLISPIPASITKDAPHTNRMMCVLPLPAIISAIGVYAVYLIFKKIHFRTVGKIVILLVLTINLLIYLDQYFFHFPYISAKNWGGVYKQLVYKVKQIEKNYQEIVIAKPELSPYIYFLFYNKVDPFKFQKEVIRYSETEEGFQHVKQFDNYYFQKNNWSDELFLPNRLYIEWADGMPEIATHSVKLVSKNDLERLNKDGLNTSGINIGDVVISKVIDQVLLPDNTPYIYLIETVVTKFSSILPD